MSYPNTASDVLEISSRNGLSLQEYILQYGGSYPQDEIDKMAAMMSPVSIQLIADQYKAHEAYYISLLNYNQADLTWAEYLLSNAQEMARRAVQWASIPAPPTPPGMDVVGA